MWVGSSSGASIALISINCLISSWTGRSSSWSRETATIVPRSFLAALSSQCRVLIRVNLLPSERDTKQTLQKKIQYLRLGGVFKPLSVQWVLGSILGQVKSVTMAPTARHRCDVSSELCCSGTKLRDGYRHSLHAVLAFGGKSRNN